MRKPLAIQKCDRRTNGLRDSQMDGWMDGQTDMARCRVACLRLRMNPNSQSVDKIELCTLLKHDLILWLINSNTI